MRYLSSITSKSCKGPLYKTMIYTKLLCNNYSKFTEELKNTLTKKIDMNCNLSNVRNN